MKPLDIPSEVRAGIEAIAAHTSAEQIILFGSRARGDHDEGSDWDLLVIVPDGTPDARRDRGALMRLSKGSGIEPHPVRRSMFEERKFWNLSLSRAAVEDGIVVWIREPTAETTA